MPILRGFKKGSGLFFSLFDSGQGKWELSGNQLFLNYNNETVRVCRIILFDKEIRIRKDYVESEGLINDPGFKAAGK